MKKINAKNTKAEILDAYQDLIADYKLLQREANQAAKPAAAQDPHTPSTQEQAMTTKRSTIAQMSQDTLDVEGFLGGLASLRAGFGECANSLRHSLSKEASALVALREQIAQQLEQIRTLHDLELHEGTLDELIARYEAMEREHEAKLEQTKETAEQELEQAWIAWDREKLTHHDTITQRDAAIAREQARELAQYTYTLAQTRAQDQDAYDQAHQARRAALQETVSAKQQEWASREEALSERELELMTLEAKKEAFPQELEEALNKARAEGAGIAKRQSRVEADLLAKEHEGKRRVFELQIQSLQDTITRQGDQLSRLTQQLSQAQAQAQELATKAIEGASNVTSLHAIREIAMEQAKQNAKSK